MKQAHAQNQHHRAAQKHGQRSRFQRRYGDANQKHHRRDGQHRTEGFHNLFLEPFIHCIAPLLYNLCIIITEKNGIAKPDFVKPDGVNLTNPPYFATMQAKFSTADERLASTMGPASHLVPPTPCAAFQRRARRNESTFSHFLLSLCIMRESRE